MKLPQSDQENLQKNLIVNIIINDETLNAFLIRSRIKQKCLFLPLSFNILLEILLSAVRQGKEIKGIQIEKKVGVVKL